MAAARSTPLISAHTAHVSAPYRIMLVDDSAVIRGLLHRWLSADPECVIVGSYHNGLQAVQKVKASGAEIVILDIEMPGMNGLTALPQIIREVPGIQVLMASTLTRRNAEISIRALSMGAVDYLAKPEAASNGMATADFQRELVQKVKALGAAIRKGRVAPPLGKTRIIPSADGGLRHGKPPSAAVKSVSLRAPSKTPPEILAIGSSTGGPQALFKLLKGLAPWMKIPIIITQHMPPTFTAILAEHIQSLTGLPAREAMDGDPLLPGQVLIAPGNFHMTVARLGANKIIRLDQNPQVNYCRPSVDEMFESVATVYGSGVLAVILTGMGYDGREGARRLVEAGGTLIAQDEKTSVVWGMPGAVANAGLCSAVVPLDEMTMYLKRFLLGSAT